MKFSLSVIAVACVSVARAAYPDDIVQYWALQSNLLVNGTVIGGIQSPPSGWAAAVVHGAIYLAATESKGKSLAFQQLAISHAAHNALVWVFHGTRNYAPTDAALRGVLGPIGIPADSADGSAAKEIGRKAARTILVARADDGINDFVDYVFKTPAPGVYQNTSGGAPLPDTPQAPGIKLFAGVGDVKQFKVPSPPKTNSPEYEKAVLRVKSVGERTSTTRNKTETETAYYWRESSISQWTRFANAVVGDSLAKDVNKSAKFYAQFYFVVANAGIASFYIKYRENAWRPITSIRYPGSWVASGKDISQPDWTPLLNPTPSHPDYTSTHATFGGAAAQVIKEFNGGDKVDVTISSNVTVDNIGVLTRRFTNLTYANFENGESRVFGGIHFPFASTAGDKLGREVARKTLESFNDNWKSF